MSNRIAIGVLSLLALALLAHLSRRPPCTAAGDAVSATTTPNLRRRGRTVPFLVPLPPPPPRSRNVDGHEWMGGAVGRAERAGDTRRRYTSARPPSNATLLLLGVVSGAKNFDVRNWLRRAFWRQRPWRLGVDWRFVVGATLPRGDNDRVSLGYESARYGDLDIVKGSELPPRQARVAVRWWVHAAALASQPGAPAYVGLSYDSVLLSLPRVVLRLRSLALALSSSSAATASDRFRHVYAGTLHWGAWPDAVDRSGVAGRTWRCVRATAPSAVVDARLPGDTPPPAKPLRPTARQRAAQASQCRRSGSTGATAEGAAFPAAAPELQLLSSALLRHVRAALTRRLLLHSLEVAPPHSLWDRSERYHQSAAGRTPSQPALLAATALARAVHNVSLARPVNYVQLQRATEIAAFSWEAEPGEYPGTRALLARGITDGIAAEAVVERFDRQHSRAAAATGRMRCSRERCTSWGLSSARSALDGAVSPEATTCCEEMHLVEHAQEA